MNWREIEEKYNHFNNDWAHYPKEFCQDDLKPSYNEVFEKYQETKDENWFESTHPFCKSCFSTYKEVCEEVGLFFNLGRNWRKEDLTERVNDFIITYFESTDNNIFEQALQPFIDCINARWFQHDNCFLSSDKEVNNNVEVSNDDHMMFLLILCREVKKLYSIYKSLINSKNQKLIALNSSTNKKIPLVKDFLKDNKIINICRNVIKNYGNSIDKKNIDLVFESEIIKIQRRKSKSPVRNRKVKKQSRNKEAYKVTGETMKELLKRKFNID